MTRNLPFVRRRSWKGFSLLELLTVIVIIGVVTAIGVTRLRSSALRADASARLVRTTLQTQQRTAIARQSNMIVMFDTARRGMQVVDDQNGNDTLNVGERTQWYPLSEETSFRTPTLVGTVDGTSPLSPFQGTDVRTVGGMPALIFRRDGSASSWLVIYVAGRPELKNEYRAVQVDPATGRVDIFRYDGTGWQRLTN